MTTTHLKLSDWEHLIPETPSRIRANHIGDHCEGGRDSMIVERKEDGTANAYCFRCGASGYYSPTRYFKPPSKDDGSHHRSPTDRPATVPSDAHSSFAGWPREAREWLLRGGVDSAAASARGILWSESKEKLYLPVNGGWVVRGFSPKYYRKMGGIKFGHQKTKLASGIINNRVVIVEDTLSMWRCAEVIDSIALLGTKMCPEVVSLILKEEYGKVYVWLDNDNPEVTMGARKIVKQLPFVETVVVNATKDPKYHSVESIKEILK